MELDLQPGDEALLRHYLLGELSESEQDRIEERLFAEEDYGEYLALVEDDLIDSYIGGDLSSHDRDHFESHFLSSPRRRERVAFAKAWLSPPLAAGPGQQQAGARNRLMVLRNSPIIRQLPKLAWVGALVAAAAFVFITGSVMIRFNTYLKQQEYENVRQAKQIEDLRVQLASRPPAAGVPERLGNTPEPSPAALLSFVLIPDVQRNTSRPEQRLVIAPGRNAVQLDLHFSSAMPYPVYRVVIQNFEGSQIWGKDQISASTTGTGFLLKLMVPSTVLRQGDYRVLISGITASGEPEDLNDYFAFHVAPQ